MSCLKSRRLDPSGSGLFRQRQCMCGPPINPFGSASSARCKHGGHHRHHTYLSERAFQYRQKPCTVSKLPSERNDPS